LQEITTCCIAVNRRRDASKLRLYRAHILFNTPHDTTISTSELFYRYELKTNCLRDTFLTAHSAKFYVFTNSYSIKYMSTLYLQIHSSNYTSTLYTSIPCIRPTCCDPQLHVTSSLEKLLIFYDGIRNLKLSVSHLFVPNTKLNTV